MMTRATGGILLTIIFASASSVPSRAADEIKAGKWEFTTQMQLPGAAQPPPGVQASAGGSAPMIRTSCIDAANPIPAEGQCKLDRVDHRRRRHLGNDLQHTQGPDPLRRLGALRRRHDGGDIDRSRSGSQRSAGRYSGPYHRALSRPLRCKIAASYAAVDAADRMSCSCEMSWLV